MYACVCVHVRVCVCVCVCVYLDLPASGYISCTCYECVMSVLRGKLFSKTYRNPRKSEKCLRIRDK